MCPIGRVTAVSQGLSRAARQQARRSAIPQVAALQRHRLPKLTVRSGANHPAPARAWLHADRTILRSLDCADLCPRSAHIGGYARALLTAPPVRAAALRDRQA